MNQTCQKKSAGMTAIVDTRCANLASVKYALCKLGITPVITADKSVLKNADRVILPGVGSASVGMKYLNSADLTSFIHTLSCPVLGICLGMQLLGKFSEEGETQTLGIIDDTVKALSPQKGIRLPHMGWNRLTRMKQHPLFKNIPEDGYFYFVHSYAYVSDQYALACCEHGQRFVSVIEKDNFMGVQFHPERSGENGMCLLENFIQMGKKQIVRR